MKGDHVGRAGSLLEGDRASPALDDRRVAEQGIGSQYVAAESAESARDSTADPAEPDDRHAERTQLATPYGAPVAGSRSEEHTSELQSRGHLVCRLLLEKKKKKELTIAMKLNKR